MLKDISVDCHVLTNKPLLQSPIYGDFVLTWIPDKCDNLPDTPGATIQEATTDDRPLRPGQSQVKIRELLRQT